MTETQLQLKFFHKVRIHEIANEKTQEIEVGTLEAYNTTNKLALWIDKSDAWVQRGIVFSPLEFEMYHAQPGLQKLAASAILQHKLDWRTYYGLEGTESSLHRLNPHFAVAAKGHRTDVWDWLTQNGCDCCAVLYWSFNKRFVYCRASTLLCSKVDKDGNVTVFPAPEKYIRTKLPLSKLKDCQVTVVYVTPGGLVQYEPTYKALVKYLRSTYGAEPKLIRFHV